MSSRENFGDFSVLTQFTFSKNLYSVIDELCGTGFDGYQTSSLTKTSTAFVKIEDSSATYWVFSSWRFEELPFSLLLYRINHRCGEILTQEKRGGK